MPIIQKLTRLDVFGSVTHLTFKGKAKYKTRFGACVSLLLATVLISIATHELVQIYQDDIRSISTQTRFSSVDEELDPFERGYKFAFGFQRELDPRYGSFVVEHVTKQLQADGT